jgi:hypothetical protein
MLVLIELVYNSLLVFLSICVLLLLIFMFLKCCFILVSKSLFVFPVYLLEILAIDLINVIFIFFYSKS